MKLRHMFTGIAVLHARQRELRPRLRRRPLQRRDTTAADRAGQWRRGEDSAGGREARSAEAPPERPRRALTACKSTRAELKGEYKKWLDEDVRWIITDEEERRRSRASPTMRSATSSSSSSGCAAIRIRIRRRTSSSDEHYARIAYANEHFAAGKPGWMTDRGHIYIAYGKPDNIDSHPSGGKL